MKEKVEGERGEDGFERWKNLGLLRVVLHLSLGLSVGGGRDAAAAAAALDGFVAVAEPAIQVVVVRQRRLGLETTGCCDCKRGVEGLEKKPILVLNLGVVGLLFFSCFTAAEEADDEELDRWLVSRSL